MVGICTTLMVRRDGRSITLTMSEKILKDTPLRF